MQGGPDACLLHLLEQQESQQPPRRHTPIGPHTNNHEDGDQGDMNSTSDRRNSRSLVAFQRRRRLVQPRTQLPHQARNPAAKLHELVRLQVVADGLYRRVPKVQGVYPPPIPGQNRALSIPARLLKMRLFTKARA